MNGIKSYFVGGSENNSSSNVAAFIPTSTTVALNVTSKGAGNIVLYAYN